MNSCIYMYYIAPCLPSPCINNGRCVVNSTAHYCVCVGSFNGEYCESTHKVHTILTNVYIYYILSRVNNRGKESV